MSERYSKLFALPENLHTSGSPIVIVAGALLKDTQIGNVIAQLKFKNISPKNIKALIVRIRAKDISGVDVEGVDNFQYLDLNVYRDSEFGAKTPIVLPNAVARSFSCECLSAVFSDGTNWVCAEDAKWDVLPGFISLEGQLGTDLAEQYKRDTGSKSKYTITEHDDLWYCTCGAINHSNERVCHSCNLNKSTLLAALDTDTLTANKEKFEGEEAARQAEENAAAAARTKKITKAVSIGASIVALVIAIVVFLNYVIIPTSKYNNAMALMNAGKYEEAITAFRALGDFKDSDKKRNECYNAIINNLLNDKYDAAIELMQQGKYSEAFWAFQRLGNFKDSADKMSECREAMKQK